MGTLVPLLAIACGLPALSACCLSVVGGTDESSTTSGMITTGGSSGGIVNDLGILWVSGVGALTAAQLAQSGAVSFNFTCSAPCPPANSGLDGGAAAVNDAALDLGHLWTQQCVGVVWVFESNESCASTSAEIRIINPRLPLSAMAFDYKGGWWTSVRAVGIGYWLPLGSVGFVTQPFPTQCGGPTTVCNPTGIAFDSAGYLWVANDDYINAYSPSTFSVSPPS